MMRRFVGGGVLFLTAVITLLMLSACSLASAAEAMQEEPRGTPTSHTNNRMFMYGIQGAGQYATWETWSHAGGDGSTEDSFSENNAPGQANSGGGQRVFRFMGSAPNQEPVRMDKSEPFRGSFTLSLSCAESQGTCTKDVRVNLLYGQSTIGSIMLNGPVEGSSNFYEFNISHDLDEIEENVTLGLEIEFTKPHDFTGGYTLYLANDFPLEVPALPPEEFVIEVEEGAAYESPFTKEENGFRDIPVEEYSIITPILWGVGALAIGIPLITFTPTLPLKIPSIIFLMIGLIISSAILPMLVMSTPYDEAELGKTIYTIEDIVSQGQAEGQFLSGFMEGDEFQLWIPLDSVNKNTLDTLTVAGLSKSAVYGMGFESYTEILSDPGSTTKHGLSHVQGFFSLLATDPSAGHGVLIDVELVKRCGECTEVVPLWGQVDDNQQMPVNNTIWTMLDDGTMMHVVPDEAITVTNVDYSWQQTPMNTGIGAGALLLLIGGILQYRALKDQEAWVAEQSWDEDDELLED